ncbi:MAG: hypothetical protein HUJ25_05225 [Crocinitomicaceae bacterium]|nr:hypothetical protein [Crocinitomicaceae bacterium]
MNKLLFILFLIVSTISFGQYDMDEASDTTEKEQKVDTYELKKHIYVGGDLSLSFGAQTYLYIAPLAGYEIWQGISAGVSTMYQLYRVNFTNGSSLSSHSFGGGIFARWRPPVFPYILLQTEFDVYNAEDFTTLYSGDRANVPAFMSGLGYAGGMGKAYYQILLMYDFVNDVNNPLPKLFGNIPLYLRYGMVFYLG